MKIYTRIRMLADKAIIKQGPFYTMAHFVIGAPRGCEFTLMDGHTAVKIATQDRDGNVEEAWAFFRWPGYIRASVRLRGQALASVAQAIQEEGARYDYASDDARGRALKHLTALQQELCLDIESALMAR